MEEKVDLFSNFNCYSDVVLSAFAGSVWLNDVFLGTSFGKYVKIVIDLENFTEEILKFF